MAKNVVLGLKILFVALGSLNIAMFIGSCFVYGQPFNTNFITPWVAAALVDFFINVFILGVWISYKEASWLRVICWLVLISVSGSPASYILLQLFQLSPQEASQDPIYHILLRRCDKGGVEQKRKHSSVMYARIIFGFLGCLMFGTLLYTLLTDGSPFCKELITPWMTATIIDIKTIIVVLYIWVAYKETSWLSALFWIILLMGFGSITACVYIVLQLLRLSSQDPLYLVLINSSNRARKQL